MEAYRIFERRNGQPCTLFHGLGGSRTLPIDTWLDAERKQVSNPGKRSRGLTFMSGFHCCRTEAEAYEYACRFKPGKRDLVICRVLVDGVREKPRARAEVLLADRMMVTAKDWADACCPIKCADVRRRKCDGVIMRVGAVEHGGEEPLIVLQEKRDGQWVDFCRATVEAVEQWTERAD